VFDRRTSTRRSLHWPIQVEGKDNFGEPFHETSIIKNLSSSGAYFYLDHEVALGTSISLSIKLTVQNERWMKYTAQVIRVELGDDRIGIGVRLDPMPQKFGVGIHFDSSKPEFVN
jgi:hypothetical protein